MTTPEGDLEFERRRAGDDGDGKRPPWSTADRSEETVLERARRTIRRVLEAIRGTEIDLVEYQPSVHGPLLEFDGSPGLEEVDRYWVNAPFAFVTIGYDPDANHHRYHVVEPTLRPDERVLLETLFEDVRDPLLYRDEPHDDVETLLRETIHEYLERYGAER